MAWIRRIFRPDTSARVPVHDQYISGTNINPAKLEKVLNKQWGKNYSVEVRCIISLCQPRA